MEIRVLNPVTDDALFETIWQWQFEKSNRWQQLFSIWKETRDEFLAATFSESQIDFGVFDEANNLQAVITLEEQSPRIFEAHIDYPRPTNRLVLLDAIESIRRHIFERGARAVFVFVAEANRPMARIVCRAGFRATGVEVLYGNLNGKVVVWRQFALFPEEAKNFD